MKNAVFGFTVVVSILLLAAWFQRPWPGVAIELDSCQPDGARAKLHRAWEPRSFWVEQHVILESALRETDLPGLLEDCASKERTEEKVAACQSFYAERQRKLQRCFSSVAAQCGREGGLC